MRIWQKRAWPPYELTEQTIESGAARKMDRLERLYHVGQHNIWSGKEVLDGLIAKHGRPKLDPARKDAALPVLSLLLWGELASWAISADLAERIDDVEAKMAATAQAHDEARHFYVLRDYLRELGEPVPRMGGLARKLLLDILESELLAQKLFGMQLLVESNALSIFRALAEAQVDPVLSELMPYYERDEARHVGFGALYLPRVLKRLSVVERARVIAFQLQCALVLMSSGRTMQPHFRVLGMNQREMALRIARLQQEVMKEINDSEPSTDPSLDPSRRFGPRLLDFVHPPNQDLATWHRIVLGVWARAAGLADRALV
jgi:hypothetical protein